MIKKTYFFLVHFLAVTLDQAPATSAWLCEVVFSLVSLPTAFLLLMILNTVNIVTKLISLKHPLKHSCFLKEPSIIPFQPQNTFKLISPEFKI